MPANTYMATIVHRGFLVAGVDQNTYRWGYLNLKESPPTLEGFDIDMVKQIAIALFGDAGPDHLHLVIVPNKDRQVDVASETVRPGGQASDGVDVVAETMTITCDRQNGKSGPAVDFSNEYYHAHQGILVPDTSTITPREPPKQALAGRRVCAAAGSTSLSNLAQMVPRAKLFEAANQTDCLVMLQQGQVDAISTDDTILDGWRPRTPTQSAS